MCKLFFVFLQGILRKSLNYPNERTDRTSILQMWILKGYTFNKSSDDFIMNIQ
ncbi:hypothetical protein [Rickettsia endosymbiont of Cantharis rufa]|uniref:hypothetical protein n=1 Tax=Rickettsia endosymbiont of Cantharis rufa TaxID=3066248 RepID=UPI0031331ABE